MAKKIIIVEDDRFLRKVYEEKFKSMEGYETLSAADGVSALDLIRKEHPDLVLLDLVLPEMDGFTVLEKLKVDPELADIPVIILSNLGQEEDLIRGQELGAADYLIKSDVTIKSISEKIKKILSTRKKAKTVKKPAGEK